MTIKTGIITNPEPKSRRSSTRRKSTTRRAAKPRKTTTKRATANARRRRGKRIGSYTISVRKNPQTMIGSYSPMELGALAFASIGGVVAGTVTARVVNEKMPEPMPRGLVKVGLGGLAIVAAVMASKSTGRGKQAEKRALEAAGFGAGAVLGWSGVADLLGLGDGEAVPSSVRKTSAITMPEPEDEDMDGWFADSDTDEFDDDDEVAMSGPYDEDYDDDDDYDDEDMDGPLQITHMAGDEALRDAMSGIVPASRSLQAAMSGARMGAMQPATPGILPPDTNILQ